MSDCPPPGGDWCSDVLRHHWRSVLVGIGARFAENTLYYTDITFSITYLKRVAHKDTTEILLLMLGAHLLHVFMIPLMGYLSDLMGRKPVYWVGAALISIVAVGLTRETRGKSLHQVDAESQARLSALDGAACTTPRRGDWLA